MADYQGFAQSIAQSPDFNLILDVFGSYSKKAYSYAMGYYFDNMEANLPRFVELWNEAITLIGGMNQSLMDVQTIENLIIQFDLPLTIDSNGTLTIVV